MSLFATTTLPLVKSTEARAWTAGAVCGGCSASAAARATAGDNFKYENAQCIFDVNKGGTGANTPTLTSVPDKIRLVCGRMIWGIHGCRVILSQHNPSKLSSVVVQTTIN